jgi:hypothetical protein
MKYNYNAKNIQTNIKSQISAQYFNNSINLENKHNVLDDNNNKMNEKITIIELIQYIKSNKNAINSVNIIDLNSVKNNLKKSEKELTHLKFQDVRQVNYLPTKLNEIFDVENNKYLHAGVLEKIPIYDNTNISLYSSILVCLKQNFFSQNMTYQQQFVSTFINCLNSDTKKFNYRKYNWEKDDLNKSFSKGFIGTNIMKYLSDFLCINIFVLDIEKDNLFYAGGEYFVPYKKTIFLIHYTNNIFEPLYTESARFFSINDNIIKTIRNLQNIDVYRLSNDMNFEFKEKYEDLELYLNIKKNGDNNKVIE